MPSENSKETGYIKLWRDLTYSKLWNNINCEHFKIAIEILELAKFKRETIELLNGEKITLEPGQLITTKKYLSDRSGETSKRKVSEKAVRGALTSLKKIDFLDYTTIKSIPRFWVENEKKWADVNGKMGRPKNENGQQYKNDIFKEYNNMSDSKESDAPPGAFKDSINTNKKTKSSKKKTTKVFEENSIEYQLSEKFYRKVSEFNSSKYDEKPDLQKWSSEFEKLMRLDKVKSEDIETLIDWIFQEGNFWNDKVQTPAKFRKRDKEEVKYFNKIFKQMEKDPNYYRPSQKDLEKELPPITAEEFYDI